MKPDPWSYRIGVLIGTPLGAWQYAEGGLERVLIFMIVYPVLVVLLHALWPNTW